MRQLFDTTLMTIAVGVSDAVIDAINRFAPSPRSTYVRRISSFDDLNDNLQFDVINVITNIAERG